MSALCECLDIPLTQRQVRKIAELWRQHENHTGREMFSQPVLKDSYTQGVLRIAVLDAPLSRAVRETMYKHVRERPRLKYHLP